MTDDTATAVLAVLRELRQDTAKITGDIRDVSLIVASLDRRLTLVETLLADLHATLAGTRLQ